MCYVSAGVERLTGRPAAVVHRYFEAGLQGQQRGRRRHKQLTRKSACVATYASVQPLPAHEKTTPKATNATTAPASIASKYRPQPPLRIRGLSLPIGSPSVAQAYFPIDPILG